MTHKIYQVGMAGWGLAGRTFHAPLITMTEGLHLTHVVTSQQVDSTLFPDVTVCGNFEDLLKIPELDLVVIATPNFLHVSQATAALQAGKHVVIDKPIAGNEQEVMNLYNLAKREKRKIFPFQNRRWDGDFLTVQALLESEKLGKLHHFESRWPYYRPHPKPRSAWKGQTDALGGVFYDLAPHLIDGMIALFGKPLSVYARIASHYPAHEVHDYFHLTFFYESGLQAILEVDMLNAMPVPRFHIRGDSGTFEKYGLDVQESHLKKGQIPPDGEWQTEPSKQWGVLRSPTDDGTMREEKIETHPGAYPQYYEVVYQSLAANADFPITPQQIVWQFQVLDAALHSAAESRVITL